MLKENVKHWEQEIVQAGIELGEEKASIRIVSGLITRRFGKPAPEIYEKLKDATPEQIDEWSLRILEAQTIDDVFKH